MASGGRVSGRSIMSYRAQHWRRLRNNVRARGSGFWLTILLALWIAAIIDGYQPPSVPQADEQQGYDPAVQDSALRSWDRIYRLNAALDDAPAWLRRMMNHEPESQLMAQVHGDLTQLWLERQFNQRGCTTLAVLDRYWRESNPQANESQAASENDAGEAENPPPYIVETWVQEAFVTEVWSEEQWRTWEHRLQDREVLWWEVAYLAQKARAEQVTLLDDEIATQRARNESLLRRSAAAYLGTAGLWLAGMCCLPWALRRMVAGWKAVKQDQTVRYTQRLSFSLVALWLLATEQVNNYLLVALNWLMGPWQREWWWQVVTDTLWRLFPVVVMLWMFYRKRAWVVRGFGLNQAPQWGLILAMYALLMVLDQGLLGLMHALGQVPESYQLDPLERGWHGLLFGLISACVLAPIAEEFIYRGFLFQGLSRKTGVWCAALLSSLIFALCHFYDLYGTISVGLCGMATALVYYCTRSLTQAIVLHAVYNLCITVPGWMLFHLELS